ncbi:MAG TPA: Ig-like domain-containing protein [Candidatus Sulfotelmatobacter sp.]|nr:Ig-like domain-containing protein [Candidatus Sulfotelmatobacter sp.]
MRNSFWNKRIPTLLGLLIILLGIFATSFLTNNKQLIQTNASNSSQPKDVRVTNVKDNSFTVSYSTDSLVSGSLNYGIDKNMGQSVLDDRDQKNSSVGNYSTHFITIKNLTPSTKYYFTIISGQQTYTTNDVPFEITTGPPLINNSDQVVTLRGHIGLLDGSAPKEAIIYITTDNAQVLSLLASEDGNYAIPLSETRSSDLSSIYNFKSDTVIKILAVNSSLSSNAILYYSQAEDIPQIILSKDYDFRENQIQTASPSANLESFPSFTSGSSDFKKIPKIITPQNDQGFSDQKPLFKGTSVPGENVEIVIHSDEKIQTNISADSFGNWSFRPSTALSPGNHTITIITKDASGILRTITQSFVVYASGTQVSQSATPSASLTPTPTEASLPSPTEILTPIPTINEISDISSISATPTGIEKPLPATGNPFIITAGIAGIFISLIGGLLFLLNKKGI